MAVFFPTDKALYRIDRAQNQDSPLSWRGVDREEDTARAALKAYERTSERLFQVDPLGGDPQYLGRRLAAEMLIKYIQQCVKGDGGPKLVIEPVRGVLDDDGPGARERDDRRVVDCSLEAAVGFAFYFHAALEELRKLTPAWDDDFVVTAEILADGSLGPVQHLSEKYNVVAQWAAKNNPAKVVKFLYAAQSWRAPAPDDELYAIGIEPIRVEHVRDLFRVFVDSTTSERPPTGSFPPAVVSEPVPARRRITATVALGAAVLASATVVLIAKVRGAANASASSASSTSSRSPERTRADLQEHTDAGGAANATLAGSPTASSLESAATREAPASSLPATSGGHKPTSAATRPASSAASGGVPSAAPRAAAAASGQGTTAKVGDGRTLHFDDDVTFGRSRP